MDYSTAIFVKLLIFVEHMRSASVQSIRLVMKPLKTFFLYLASCLLPFSVIRMAQWTG